MRDRIKSRAADWAGPLARLRVPASETKRNEKHQMERASGLAGAADQLIRQRPVLTPPRLPSQELWGSYTEKLMHNPG